MLECRVHGTYFKFLKKNPGNALPARFSRDWVAGGPLATEPKAKRAARTPKTQNSNTLKTPNPSTQSVNRLWGQTNRSGGRENVFRGRKDRFGGQKNRPEVKKTYSGAKKTGRPLGLHW